MWPARSARPRDPSAGHCLQQERCVGNRVAIFYHASGMPTVEEAKCRGRSFWESAPSGTRELVEEEGSASYFPRPEQERDRLEPFIASFARFDAWRGRRVLEVGFGAGTDFAYSWGVLHHTPDTARALGEVQRVLRPGGELCVMLYNRHSLVALQAWVLCGLLRRRPRRSLAAIIAAHVEGPGTRAYAAL
jgi:hypothetical protein